MRIRLKEPYLSILPGKACDLEESVYGKVTELLPTDAPVPLGKHVVTVIYHDSNLYSQCPQRQI